jgi:CelD/BcsL family acetyltransferase involved in cellulose biosynthesis
MREQYALNINATAEKLDYPSKRSLALQPKLANTAAGKRIALLSTHAEILALESSWRELESKNSITTNVFQSFEWAKCWCETHLQTDGKNELYVFAGYENASLVFLFPLSKSYHYGIKTLQWLTEPLGQYGDVLCASGQDASRWIAIALDEIRKSKDVDIIRLRHVRKDSIIEQSAAKHLTNAKCYERAPYLDLSAFKTDADYDARYTSTQRKRRKKIRKKLGDMGEVKFNVIKTGGECDAAITKAIIEKNAWLSDRGRFNRIMGCDRHINFLKALSRSNSTSFAMNMTELKAGDKSVSWEVAFRYRGTHFTYITSHVNALTDLSPGRLHMDLSQRAALAAGQARFDLMVPYDAHKESWSSAIVAASDYYHPITTSGHLYGTLYLRILRPIVRKIYYSLPQRALLLLQICCTWIKQ